MGEGGKSSRDEEREKRDDLFFPTLTRLKREGGKKDLKKWPDCLVSGQKEKKKGKEEKKGVRWKLIYSLHPGREGGGGNHKAYFCTPSKKTTISIYPI